MPAFPYLGPPPPDPEPEPEPTEVIVGGLRARLVRDSLYNLVRTGLTSLGWFADDRQHSPINMIPGPVDYLTEVPPNTLTVVDEDVEVEDVEMGSNLAEHYRQFYIDFFAEDDIVGVALIEDVRAILEGRIPSIGRTRPILPLYDYRQSPAELIANLQLEDITVDRDRTFSQPWLRYWRACAVTVVDVYAEEVTDE